MRRVGPCIPQTATVACVILKNTARLVSAANRKQKANRLFFVARQIGLCLFFSLLILELAL